MFAFTVPALLLVFGIGMGARTIAREEERGTVDLLLSLPVTRRRVLLEKAAGGACVLFGLGAVLFLALLAGSTAVDMEIAAARLAEISLATVLLVPPFAALALAVSCAIGARGPAAAPPAPRRSPPTRSTRSRRSSTASTAGRTCRRSRGTPPTRCSRVASSSPTSRCSPARQPCSSSWR